MAIYKTTSSQVILRKVMRDLNPENANWVDDAVEWIGEALEHIGAAAQLTQQGCILDVKDLNISNPEAVEALLNNIPGVVDNGIFAFNKPKTVLVSE